MKPTLFLALTSAFIFACSGGDSEGSTADGGGTANVEPASGSWDYSQFTTVSNTCSEALEGGQPAGGFTLLNNGDGSFTVTPGDGTAPFDCTVSGSNYTCASATAIEEEIQGATVTGVGAVTGSFTDAASATGNRLMEVTCAGAGCANLEALGASFPCQLEVDYNATLQAAP